MIANGAVATLVRCDLLAGDGADGTDGADSGAPAAPAQSGTDAVACGAMRLWACAKAPVCVAKAKPAATTTATPMRKAFTSHPDIAAFVDLNHGNFMLWPARQADHTAQQFPLCG